LREPILIAEDEEHIAKLIAFKLQKSGYDVVVASNGHQALEHARSRPFSLLILDVMMPVQDGWQTLQAIRSDSRIQGLPVLMLTAKSRASDLARSVELGATRFLAKPFDPEELVRRVAEILDGTSPEEQ
jgi:DNA-binding response OmpR family regulator